MANTIKTDANFKIIEWAIKSSGWETDELLEKAEISKNVYERWAEKLDTPTLKQLKIISEKTKRPLAIFFSDKIPEEKPNPKDFRLNPKQKGKFDKKTIFEIRKARKLQGILKDFGENEIGDKIKNLNVKINDSPQKVALELREKFGITEELQRKAKTPWEFFRLLRKNLEDEKVFNFQFSMPTEDARGFALSDELPKVVVVNSGDVIEARIFTLMHELGHVLLGDTEIGIPDFNDENKSEIWCNEFASSFLLPPKTWKKIIEENKGKLTEPETLKSLSSRYKVSRSMLLCNMVKLKFIKISDYEKILKDYEGKNKKSGGEGISIDERRLRELGPAFVSLVADNVDRKTITYSDALDYLSIKSGDFKKLMNNI